MQPPPLKNVRIFVGEVPIAPLIIEVTDAERAALISAKSGRTTTDDSDEGQMFLALEERGMVKVVTLSDGWTAWKLSGDGLKIAFEGDA